MLRRWHGWAALGAAIAVLFALGTAEAGKGNGNGNGNGGGGAGGGGDDTPPPGVIYLDSWSYVTNQYGQPVWSDPEYYGIESDGTVSATFPFALDALPAVPRPSHDLHAGGQAFIGESASQSSVYALTAFDGQGNTRDLFVQPAARLGVFDARFAKDDGSVTFTAEVVDAGTGSESTRLFWAPVSWDSGGLPTLDAAPVVIWSQPHNGDWSSDGSQMVYEDGGSMYVASFDLSGAAPAHTGTVSIGSGADPQWSPVAGSTTIVYSLDNAIHAIASDGSGKTKLTSDKGRTTLRGQPHWSPDGNHIGYVIGKQTKFEGKTVWVSSLHIVGSNGGGNTEIDFGQGDIYHLRGWRE